LASGVYIYIYYNIICSYAFHTLRRVVEGGVLAAAAASRGRGAGRGGPRVGVGPAFLPTAEARRNGRPAPPQPRRPAPPPPPPPPHRCVGKGYTNRLRRRTHVPRRDARAARPTSSENISCYDLRALHNTLHTHTLRTLRPPPTHHSRLRGRISPPYAQKEKKRMIVVI